jgi:hypothetical protein
MSGMEILMIRVAAVAEGLSRGTHQFVQLCCSWVHEFLACACGMGGFTCEVVGVIVEGEDMDDVRLVLYGNRVGGQGQGLWAIGQAISQPAMLSLGTSLQTDCPQNCSDNLPSLAAEPANIELE